MREIGTFELIFYLPIFFLLGWLLIVQCRHFFRRYFSIRWPTTTATIEKGFVGKIQGLGGRAGFFGYRFAVSDVAYVARFLIIDDEEHARELQAKLDGLLIVVKYDPADPRVSFIVDRYDPRFEGHTAQQNPFWFYGSSSLKMFQTLGPKE